MDDLISKQAAIDALHTWFRDGFDEDKWWNSTHVLAAIEGLPPAQLGTNLAEVGMDCISRQQAISAICNACGKIDCDKMDKCEKLQLPPANCSEFPNNSDTISRQAAIDALRKMQTYKMFSGDDMLLIDQAGAQTELMLLPPIQPEIIKCMECIHYEADIMGNPWGVCCHKDWIANNIGHNVDENGWCYRADMRGGQDEP